MSEANPNETAADAPDASAAAPLRRDVDQIPRLGFFELVPRRNLVKIAMLLLVLAGIIFIQRRSTTVIKRITDVMMPAPLPASEAPRVRLAPPGPRRP